MEHSLKRVLRELAFRTTLVASAVAMPYAATSAAPYAITDLGTFGGSTSEAYAINDRGQVVGTADLTNALNWEHAFLYTTE